MKEGTKAIDERYETSNTDHSWLDTLIRQYSVTKKQLEEYRLTLIPENPEPINKQLEWVFEKNSEQKDEHQVVSEMISDLQYSLEYMRIGRKPGNRRGYDKRSVYQRTVLLDTDLFPSLMIDPDNEKDLTDDQKRNMVDLLWTLSNRERQCYILHHAYMLSQREIAEELNVSRRSVRTWIERATKKIKKIKE